MTNSSHKIEIMKKLYSQFQHIKPNVKKFDNNLVLAQAECLIEIINKMTPQAHLFDDAFKQKIKEYITVYEKAREKPSTLLLTELSLLVKPTYNLIHKMLIQETVGK